MKAQFFQGVESALPATITSGTLYFCTDTGNIYFDYDNSHRKLMSENGGVKVVRLSQAEYDAMSTHDSNTIYVVTTTSDDIIMYLGDTEFSGSGGGGGIEIPVGEVTISAKKYKSGTVGLQWTDPDDAEISGVVMATWKKTVVVRKTGSMPTTYDDGTIVAQETVKDSYASTYLYDTGLTNGTTYYYGIFTQSSTNTWSEGTTFSITPQAIAPAAPTGLTLKGNNGSFTATWTNPAGTIAETTNTFGSTLDKMVLVYKTGSAPTSHSDGTEIEYSSSTTTATITATNGTTYYVAIYAKSADGGYSSAISGSVVPVAFRTMTVNINLSDSNPYTNCTYADDATSMDFVHPISASGSVTARSAAAVKDSDSAAAAQAWDDFFGHYPVVLDSSGNEYKKLNPDNFAQFEDGTDASSYISNTSYDVMIAFPIMGVKIAKNGTTLTVSMTDNPDAEADGYTYYAHTKGTTKKGNFYFAAYMARNNSNKYYSHSGVTATNNVNLTNARSYATARYTGYQLQGFYQRLFIQCMYLLKYKNTNGQAAVGQGWTSGGSSSSNSITTGTMNDKGMDYGTTTNTDKTNRVKLFGIEDFWGVYYQWLDGCYYGSSNGFLTSKTNDNFNDTGANYTSAGTWAAPNNYFTTPIGTSEGGFIPGGTGTGSETTYFADGAAASASYCLFVGGRSNDGGHCGPFFVNYSSASGAYWGLSARTCYL